MEEHRVSLATSGHSFSALSEETLLEAALRSGININYSCSSGSCADCRARLVSGQLGTSGFQDYHFSEKDKLQGYFLLCTARAASDLVIEAGEATSTQDIPKQQITTRLAKVEKVSECLHILHLNTPRTNTLRFLAGQHVSLTLPEVGTLDACVASCPCNGRQLQFHLPYDAQNPFVREVFGGLRYGSEVVVKGPYGTVTLDDDSPRPLLMLAQAHDLAPIKSLIEHAVNLDVGQSVRLFWQAKEHYLENHCRSWAEALDDYRFTALQHSGDEAITLAQRLLQAVDSEIEELADWDVYFAGSPAWITAVKLGLIAAGGDPQRLFALQRRVNWRPVPKAKGG